MWLKCIIACMLLWGVYAPSVHAQNPVVKKARILFLVDGSASMIEYYKPGQRRIDQSKQLIKKLVDSIQALNPEVEFAIRAFGHQHAVQQNNCYDSKLEIDFTQSQKMVWDIFLAKFKPTGVTPISYALKEAALKDMIAPEQYLYSIILITDGGESCGGDLCAVKNELLNAKIFFKPYILSLVDYKPLEKEYDCLGTYLPAHNEQLVQAGVDRIIKDHKPTLELLQKAPEKLANITKVEAVKQIDAPKPVEAPKPQRVITTGIHELVLGNKLKRMPEIPRRLQAPPKRTIPYSKIDVQWLTLNNDPPPVPPRKQTSMRALPLSKQLSAIKITFGTIVRAPKAVPLATKGPYLKMDWYPDETPKPVATTPKPQPPKPQPPKPTPNLTTPTSSTKPVIKTAETMSVSRQSPKPNTVAKEVEESKETELEIHLTDGKGKYYQSEPRVRIYDAATNKEVMNFYRNIDRGSGKPKKVKVPTGKYNIVIGEQGTTYVNSIEIVENKLNKIEFVVERGSIRFEWLNNPNKPMTGYIAVVNRRFHPQPTVQQRCDEQLYYEGGTYYVEVNTLPVHRASFDMDFDAQLVLKVPEPGTLVIDNTTMHGKVVLRTALGDKFAPFTNMNITGNVSAQTLKLQPGQYELEYSNGQGGALNTSILKFRIISNQTTNVHIPD